MRPGSTALVYDKVGNQIDDGQHYTYVYDAVGRLREVKTRSSTPAVVAEYHYNGLGFRTGWRSDTNTSGAVDTNDPMFWFCYDENWRIVATFRGTDSSPKETFVHHAAGLDGLGGSSYTDSVIFRDREESTAWSAASTGVLGQRHYLCQNWRADVSAVLTGAGSMVEWIKYSAYGVPMALPAGDTDSDGDWDSTDAGNITGAYDVRKDANLDGVVSAADVTHANTITGGYHSLGRGVLSSPSVANRRGFAGYEFDPTFAGASGGGRRIYHVRNRVYDADIGRWTRRDPLGYVDGMSLYEYVKSGPVGMTDPLGLFGRPSITCAGSACDPPSPPPRPRQPVSPLICSGKVCQVPAPVPRPCPGPYHMTRAEPATVAVTVVVAAWVIYCVSRVIEDGINNYDICPNDKFKHCWFSCAIARACGGSAVSLVVQLAKEAGDLFKGADIITEIYPDMEANQMCVPTESAIPFFGGWIGHLVRESCHDCCTREVGACGSQAPILVR